jgi:hypothetical protein
MKPFSSSLTRTNKRFLRKLSWRAVEFCKLRIIKIFQNKTKIPPSWKIFELEENDSNLLILDRINKKNCEKWLLNINDELSANRATLRNPKNTGNDGKVHFTDLKYPLSKKKYFRIKSQHQIAFVLVVLMLPYAPRDSGVATYMLDQKWNQKNILKKLLNQLNNFYFYHYSHQSHYQYLLLLSMLESKYSRTTPSTSLTEVSLFILFILENNLTEPQMNVVKKSVYLEEMFRKKERLFRGNIPKKCALVILKVILKTEIYKLFGRVCFCSSHDGRFEMLSILVSVIFINDLKNTMTNCCSLSTVKFYTHVIYGKYFPKEIYYLLLTMNETLNLHKTQKSLKLKLKKIESSLLDVLSASKNFKEKSITFSFIFSYECQPTWNTATCESQGTTTDVFSLAILWRSWRRGQPRQPRQRWSLIRSWSRVTPSGKGRKIYIYLNRCTCLKKIKPNEEGILGRIFKEDIRTLEFFIRTTFDINYFHYHHYYCHDHFYFFTHFLFDVSYFIFCIICTILTTLEFLINTDLRLEIDKDRQITVCIKYSVINICIFDLTSRLVLDINLGLKFTSNPMRPWSRDTSFNWLCGQKTILTTLKRSNSLHFFNYSKQEISVKSYLFWNCYKYEILKINIRHARSSDNTVTQLQRSW